MPLPFPIILGRDISGVIKATSYDVRQEMVLARLPIGATLVEIAGLIDTGHLKPHVSNLFPLSDVAKAHEMIEEGHTRGKIVLQVA